MIRRFAVVLVVLGSLASTLARAHEDDDDDDDEHEAHGALHGPVTPGEKSAYDAALPVFEKYCVACHTTQGAHHDAKALMHMNMDTYPFGGHHAAEAGGAIREVLGATGRKATMPDDNPGAVKGNDLQLVLAWADAFDEAHPPEKLHGHAHAHSMMGMGMGMSMPMSSASAVDEPAGDIPFATPRETLIPGRPGMAGGFHFMVNAFAYVTNVGLGGYPIRNAGETTDGGTTHPLLTGDWAMGYWRQRHGWAEAHLMLNFEPFTVGKAGFPELGQSGEGLVDAQHAHQLLHQAMVAFHPLAGTDGGAATMAREADYDLSIFAGQGSATIGPPVFMHRASSPGPTVPRKHHKGENPHETFPVIGASFRWRDLWLEGSAFSDLELTPDDSRFYPHPAAPESFAARVRYDVGGWLEVQVSGERLRDQGHGEPDAWQGSASGYARGTVHGWRVDGLVDYAVDDPDGAPAAHALLGEIALRDPSVRNVFWARSELNQREETADFGGGVSSPWLFETVGAEHVFVTCKCTGVRVGFFAEATLIHIPGDLASLYGHGEAVTVNVGLHLFGMWMLDGNGHSMSMSHASSGPSGDMAGMPGM